MKELLTAFGVPKGQQDLKKENFTKRIDKIDVQFVKGGTISLPKENVT